MSGPYEATGAYRPDALAQLENTEPQWSDAPFVTHVAVGKTELGYTRQVCKTCDVDWPCPEMVAFREEQVEAEVAAYERGAMGLGIAFLITPIGLFLFGLLQSGRHPDMRVVGSAAIVGALALFIGVCISGYRRRERQDTSSTTKTSKGLQQDTSGEHYWDGA